MSKFNLIFGIILTRSTFDFEQGLLLRRQNDFKKSQHPIKKLQQKYIIDPIKKMREKSIPSKRMRRNRNENNPFTGNTQVDSEIDHLTEDDWAMDLTGSKIDIGGGMAVKDLKLANMDPNLKKFDVMHTSDPHGFAFDVIMPVVYGQFLVQSEPLPAAQMGLLWYDMEAMANMHMPINWTMLSTFTMGQLRESKCLARAIPSVNVNSISIHSTKTEPMRPYHAAILSPLVTSLNDRLTNPDASSMTTSVNDYLAAQRKDTCPIQTRQLRPNEWGPVEPMINFDSRNMKAVSYIVNRTLSPKRDSSRYLTINQAIDYFNPTGVLTMTDFMKREGVFQEQPDTRYVVTAREIKVTGIDKITDIFFYPVGPREITFGANVSRVTIDAKIYIAYTSANKVGKPNPIQSYTPGSIDTKGYRIIRNDELTMRILFDGPWFRTRLGANISQPQLKHLRLGADSIMSGCALKPVQSMSVDGFAINMNDIKMMLNCPAETCHSEGLKQFAAQFNSQESSDQISEFFKWFFNTISQDHPTAPHKTRFSDDLTRGVDNVIQAAHYDCDHPGEGPPWEFNGNFPIFHWGCFCAAMVCAAISLLSFLQIFITGKFNGDENVVDEPSFPAPVVDDTPEIAGVEGGSRTSLASLARPYDFDELSIPPLAHHRVTPQWARISVPFILAASYFLFLSAITGIGEKIILFFKFAEYEGILNVTNPVTLLGSLYHMWRAHVFVLFIMVVFAGVIWPFTKIMLLFYLWYVPPRYIKSRQRGRVLEIIDFLGKLAYGDMFVIVNNMSTFQLYLTTESWPNFHLFPDGMVKFGLVVIPTSAFYFFILAAFLSQFSPTYILHLHRRAAAVDRIPTDKRSAAVAPCHITAPEEVERSTAKPLCRHKFSVSHRHRYHFPEEQQINIERSFTGYRAQNPRRFVEVTRLGKTVGALSILAPLVCLAAVVRFNIMRFTIMGVGGRLTGDQHIREMSLWKFAADVIPKHYHANAGMYIVAFAFIFRAFWTPLCFLLSLFLIWTVPLTLNGHRQMHVIAEILLAWHAIDVWLPFQWVWKVSLEPFMYLMLGDKLVFAREIVETFKETLPPDVQRFITISPQFLPPFYVLAFVSISTFIIGFFFITISRYALEDRTYLPDPDVGSTFGIQKGLHKASSWMQKCFVHLKLVRIVTVEDPMSRESSVNKLKMSRESSANIIKKSESLLLRDRSGASLASRVGDRDSSYNAFAWLV